MNLKRITIIITVIIVLMLYIICFLWVDYYTWNPELRKMIKQIRKNYGNELTLKSVTHKPDEKYLDFDFQLRQGSNPSTCNEVRKIFNHYLEAHSSENYKISIDFYYVKKNPVCIWFSNNSCLDNRLSYDTLTVLGIDIFAGHEFEDISNYNDYKDINELVLGHSRGYENIDSIFNFAHLSYLEFGGTFTTEFKERLRSKFPDCKVVEYNRDQH